MNIVIDNASQIFSFARKYGLPLAKKRGILREYLQTKILEIIYSQKDSSQLYFIGGTSLRILRNLDRFSEDLDFDLGDVSFAKIDKLIQVVIRRLNKENIELDFYKNEKNKRIYYELRFKKLLYELKISSHSQEKLMVKFDFEKVWQGHDREVILVNRYGFLFNIVAININQILVQKLVAYLYRKQTLPRDIYDIVWLTANGACFDNVFAQGNGFSAKIIEKAIAKFEGEKSRLKFFRSKLKPFLLKEEHVGKLDYFQRVLQRHIKSV